MTIKSLVNTAVQITAVVAASINCYNQDMNDEKINLFIYGSLRDTKVFKSVCGFSFTRKRSRTTAKVLFSEPALLPGHRKVSPDNVYFYAVKDKASRIDGLVIHDVPTTAMKEIERYEGKRYQCQDVHVNTANGTVEAKAYLVSPESMKKHFGDRFHVNLIHELWLRKRIEKFIAKHTRPGEKSEDAKLDRKAQRELLAATERDLVITHYKVDAISDFSLEHELDRPRPSIKHLYTEKNALPYIKNYLALVVKQVLLNQLDENIQSRFRFDLERMRSSERYYKRSVSLLIALQMINANSNAVRLILEQALERIPDTQKDLFDYIKYAVKASEGLFDPRVAHSYLEHIRSNFHPGLIPLGVEIELSNLGTAAVEPQRSIQKISDPVYDGFRYFYDFNLQVLSWKLGGYIDDHSGDTDIARRLGFFELAPGRLNIQGELSRPATADPWLLSQLIHAMIEFYDVEPHSLHLSFQLRKNQIGKQKVLPIDFVKCLFVLAGGMQQRNTGRLWVSRLGQNEITQDSYGQELFFARTSRRKWYMGTDDIADKPPTQATTHIQQYKFIRLERRANYEPLIMCLKGLQIACNPADYLSAEQLANNKSLQLSLEKLKKWAFNPTEIDRKTISKFLETVQYGLMNEAHHKPAHRLHYIDWVISALDVQLRMFNEELKKNPANNTAGERPSSSSVF